ncbi:MAG: zinc-dependent peptidase [Cyclonatronaceae bacterium]
MPSLFRKLFGRRSRWQQEGLDMHQQKLLAAGVPQWSSLPPASQQHLLGIVRVLLEEKTFEACGGLRLTEYMKLSITGFASLMLLGGRSDYFPDLRSILVYPTAYIAPVEEYDDAGFLTLGQEQRFGESWESGSMVLAWDEIGRQQHSQSAENLVIHECAHQLDVELGISLEIERGLHGKLVPDWAEALAGSYRRFSSNPRILPPVDPYGAEHHSEFFAVLSELFFTQSQKLDAAAPELYEVLCHIYRYRAAFGASEV